MPSIIAHIPLVSYFPYSLRHWDIVSANHSKLSFSAAISCLANMLFLLEVLLFLIWNSWPPWTSLVVCDLRILCCATSTGSASSPVYLLLMQKFELRTTSRPLSFKNEFHRFNPKRYNHFLYCFRAYPPSNWTAVATLMLMFLHGSSIPFAWELSSALYTFL